MTGLALDDVTVLVRGHRLLAGVSLAVGRGELVALVGPNGAGKTTLLRTVLGLVRPARGRATLDGDDVRTLTPRARAARVAWLPQRTVDVEPLAADELVATARYRFREGPEAALAGARAALARAGASAYAARNVLELSGGERQRVALAALLAQEAPLLLLDEPANHLDPAQQTEAYRLVGDLWRDGLGIVCVTHDPNLLAWVGEPSAIRVVGLAGGTIRFERPWDAADLPECLGALYGVPMTAIATDGRRLILPRLPAAPAGRASGTR